MACSNRNVCAALTAHPHEFSSEHLGFQAETERCCAKESCISPTIASKPMVRWSSSMQLKDPGPYGLGMAGDEF